MTKQKITYTIFLIVLFSYQSVQSMDTNTEKSFLHQGSLAYKNRQYKKALMYYQRALRQGKNKGLIYYNMAQSYYHLGQPWMTLVYYQKVMELHPKFDLVYLNSAKVFYELQEYYEAIKFLNHIPNNSKYYYDALLLKGSCYMKLNSFASAIIIFEKAISVKENISLGYLLIAEAAVKINDSNEATGWLEKGLIHCEEDKRIMEFLAALYFKQKKYMQSLQLYDQLSDMDKKNMTYLYSMAECHKKNKQPLLAVDILKKIILIEKRSRNAKAPYSKNAIDATDEIIRIYRSLEIWPEIENMLTQSARIYPDKYINKIKELLHYYQNSGSYRLKIFQLKIKKDNFLKQKIHF